MKAALIFAMLALSACASAPNRSASPEAEFGLERGHDPVLKARLSRIAAPIMRANSDRCPARRVIDFADEPPFEICSTQVTIIYSPVINAHTDGKRVLVTSAMMDATNDDELAFIICHELAHIVAGHKISEGSFKALELEADGIAIGLMARAGFNPNGLMPMLTRLDIGNDEPSETHPLRAERIAAMQAAIARLP